MECRTTFVPRLINFSRSVVNDQLSPVKIQSGAARCFPCRWLTAVATRGASTGSIQGRARMNNPCGLTCMRVLPPPDTSVDLRAQMLRLRGCIGEDGHRLAESRQLGHWSSDSARSVYRVFPAGMRFQDQGARRRRGRPIRRRITGDQPWAASAVVSAIGPRAAVEWLPVTRLQSQADAIPKLARGGSCAGAAARGVSEHNEARALSCDFLAEDTIQTLLSACGR